MLKKLVAIMTAFMVIFGASSFMFVDHAAAKSYKSGKKSFTPSSGQKSKVDLNKKESNVNSQKTTPDSKTKATNTAPKSNKGSFMKGLLLGGLGGLLMGSLFANMGALGSVLAFMVNMLVMAGIVMLAVRAFKYFKDQRKKKADEVAWKQ
ncbi:MULTISPECIES: hypothetical protein [Bacillus]|uniref:hypothetical protein n=1 Tax=Bacillus TaxID=1386 RepID=UPI000872267E|nr:MULTISPECIES: hypothetical protein [Bacillus]KAB2423114.1 hypothetical protein F8167_14020 [Bacillus cereus]MCM3220025.1 hypothetical protein [Bacillus cereus]OFC79900.1 hypothetical protein BTGOE1_14230 [Bacillus thuringiensis]OFC84076.1 hypothetical protein BTGOE2_29090 [Bacillus thuringiensis]TKH25645.1 hypothetical protein FC690_25115 [Bacillus cereus]